MKVKLDVWSKAMELRGFIASEFLKYHGPTDAKAGETLSRMARELGFTERKGVVLGRTIRSWGGGGAPQWAIKAMVYYILEQGFIPEDDIVLDVLIAYILVDCDSISHVKENKVLRNISMTELENSIQRVIQ